MMNNFTTMQHFNTIYTAHTKIGNREKKWREEREWKTRLLLERTPIARTLFGSLIFRWNLKGGTGAKWISIIKWRECTAVAKIFGAVYGVEPRKLFSWWKASFIHAEGIKSRVIVKMVPCFAEPWRVAKSWHWGTCNRFFKKYTFFWKVFVVDVDSVMIGFRPKSSDQKKSLSFSEESC